MRKEKQQKKPRGIEKVRSAYGYRFITPWLIGQLLFVLVPIVSSISYSFSTVNINSGHVQAVFNGVENYREMLVNNPLYVDNLRDALGSMFTSLPIIVSLSMVMALILNQKFRGRFVFRAIFFLPVIIASGVVMYVLNDDALGVPLFTMSSGAQYEYGGLIDFNSILEDLELPTQISKLFSDYLGNVFGLIWSCGVQIILFLSGLQGIPEQLYEVSKIEGATKWEEFWYLTVPMLKDVILLVLVYTMITLLTAVDNPVMAQAYSIMQESQVYDVSSAMLWGYFVIVGAVMGIVLLLYNQFCLKKWR